MTASITCDKCGGVHIFDHDKIWATPGAWHKVDKRQAGLYPESHRWHLPN